MNKKRATLTAIIFLFAIIAVNFEEGKKLYTSNAPAISHSTKTAIDTTQFRPDAKAMFAVITSEEIAGGGEKAQEVTASLKTEIARPSKIEDLAIYLNAVSSTSRMIAEFLRDKDYMYHLNQIDKSYLPSDVKLLLKDMGEFASKYPTLNDSDTRLFPKQGVLDNIVGHFVKVDKVPRMSSDRNVMYEQISNRLYILENYFYSQQFLNEMVNHD